MIIYWNDVTGSAELLENHQEAIRKLLAGECSAKQIEKLRNKSSYPVYSLRLNKKERLLFTTHKGYLHVLEYLPKHKYERSIFLNHGVKKSEFQKGILFSELESDSEVPVFNPDSNQRTFVKLHYHDKRFLSLSSSQEQILQRILMSCPSILSGPAGSGKTFVSQVLLTAQDSSKRLLFVSKEQLLVDKVKSLCEEGVLSPCTHIEFVTYDQLLKDDTRQKVDFHFFKTWFDGLKATTFSMLNDANAFYQEFYICSGFSLAGYCELGARQSSLPCDDSIRTAFYALYQRYLSYLETENKLDLAFYPLTLEHATYDLIVVDEAQSLSIHQCHQLAHLSINNAIVYCIDQHQNLVTSHASRALLELSFRHSDIQLTTHMLNETWRSKKNVAAALDKILRISRLIRNGITDKHEALEMNADNDAEDGSFCLMSSNDDIPEWLLSRAQSIELAIVTSLEYCNEARDKFKTELVFTPEEIMGQEYHTVVVYKLLANQHSLDILKEINPILKSVKEPSKHRAKEIDNCATDKYSPWINEWFTACSRAHDTLVIIDHEPKKSACFLEQFKTIKNQKDIEQQVDLSTDWQQMLKQQQQLGNEKIALRIANSYSHRSGEKSGDLGLVSQPIKPKPTVSVDQKTSYKRLPVNKKITAALPMQEISKFDIKLGEQLMDLLTGQTLNFFIISALLKNPKLDINQNRDGLTPLRIAVERGCLNLVNLLINIPTIDINYRGKDGSTSLLIASQSGQIGMVNALLAHPQIDLNIGLFECERMSPLVIACGVDKPDIVKLLMDDPRIASTPEGIKKLDQAFGNALMYSKDSAYILMTHPVFLSHIPVSPPAIAEILLHSKRCNIKDVTDLITSDERILVELLFRINTYKLKYSKDYLPLLVGLIKSRDTIWRMLHPNDPQKHKVQVNEEMFLTISDIREQLLHSVYNSRYAPEDQQHILYQALFKDLKNNKPSTVFFTDASVPTIKAVYELLQSLYNNELLGATFKLASLA